VFKGAKLYTKNTKEPSLSEKIKNDYGTLVFFCKKHNLNINTFKQIIYGLGKSRRITKILKKHKYIKKKKDLDVLKRNKI